MLERQSLVQPFVERAPPIAAAEGLDGRPRADYVKLAQRFRNNRRAMWVAIEAGEMVS